MKSLGWRDALNTSRSGTPLHTSAVTKYPTFVIGYKVSSQEVHEDIVGLTFCEGGWFYVRGCFTFRKTQTRFDLHRSNSLFKSPCKVDIYYKLKCR